MTNVSQFLNHLFSRRNKTVLHFILKLGNVHKIHDDHNNDYNYSEHLALSKKLEDETDEKIFGVLTDFNSSGLKFLHALLVISTMITKINNKHSFDQSVKRFLLFFVLAFAKAIFALLPIKIYKKFKNKIKKVPQNKTIIACLLGNALNINGSKY
ncbi:hypothetical protein RFI_36929 [Reticulomyxa filosa]|uniref:Uncharacterized protein n=1 Tax=Reticulomyxa filosa TaxID=46433 RepID=X6LGM2_RETFI|nr:hypothetical protein RFI_36929 [Reticulomyxa filosa]|eukprot:ETO00511.1 hypothetical protein RFI_36929 [Reticulomyxa filosa]